MGVHRYCSVLIAGEERDAGRHLGADARELCELLNGDGKGLGAQAEQPPLSACNTKPS